MWFKLSLFLCAGLFLVSHIESKSLPKYIKKCSLKDAEKFSKCAIEVAKAALPKILPGDKEYKIQKLDPLSIPLLQLNGNGLNLTLYNQMITGVPTVKFNSIKYDKASGKFTLDVNVDFLKLEGQYSVSGKVLVLPVTGSGDGVMEFNKGHLVFTIDMKPDKDGKLKIENEKMDVEFGNAHFDMKNLFNGDERLGTEMNKFLNDNWKDVISEFQELVKIPLNAVVKSIAKGVLENLTLKEAFEDA